MGETYVRWGEGSMLPSQTRFLNEAYAKDRKGNWKYSIVAENAPRQNSKTKKLTPFLLECMYVQHLNVFVSSFESNASRKILEDVLETINKNPELKAELSGYGTTDGKMHIDLSTGGQLILRSRKNNKAGMGGTYPVVVMDEAQELTSDYNFMVTQTMKTYKNSLIVYLGTPFLPTSTGDCFDTILESAKNDPKTFAVRYGIDNENVDITDKKLWKLTNPLYPDVIPDSAFQKDIDTARQRGDSGIIDLKIQDFGLWWKDRVPPAISSELWNASSMEVETDPDTTVCSVVFDPSTARIAVALAQFSTKFSTGVDEFEEHQFIAGEILGERPQHESWTWISDTLGKAPRDTIVILDTGGLTKPIERILPSNLYTVQLSGAEFLASQQGFMDVLENGRFKHTDQPELMAEVKNLQKIPSGATWKFAPINQARSIAGFKALCEAVWYRSVNQSENRSVPAVVYV